MSSKPLKHFHLYSVGQAADLVGVKTHTIRFWDKIFKHIKCVIGKGDRRYYDDKAVEEFKMIKKLMEAGLTSKAISSMVKHAKIRSAALKPKIEKYQTLLFEKEGKVKAAQPVENNIEIQKQFYYMNTLSLFPEVLPPEENLESSLGLAPLLEIEDGLEKSVDAEVVEKIESERQKRYSILAELSQKINDLKTVLQEVKKLVE